MAVDYLFFTAGTCQMSLATSSLSCFQFNSNVSL